MSRHIRYRPVTAQHRLVLGGYSLGAAVTDVVVAVPSPIFGYDNPLPLGMDSHIAAVALFGNGFAGLGPGVGHQSALRQQDHRPVHTRRPNLHSNLDPNTWVDNWPAHRYDAYVGAGLVNQAASFVAARLWTAQNPQISRDGDSRGGSSSGG